MVDKRPIGYMSGKPYFLERKAPRNPKYAHIGPTFISGYNINSIKVLSDRHIVNRKKELFKRIKPSTVANLMRRERHTENIYNLIKNSYSTNVIEGYPGYQAYQGYRPVKPDTRETVNRSEYSSYTSQSKVSNMSKASGLTYGTAQLSLDENTEYIIVDLREKDDYALYHIKEAIHFPGPAIARDKFPKELFAARNRFNTLIIVYHQDEKHSVPYATGLYDKGFENVFLISGGMEAFFEEAPDLIEGRSIPLPLKRNYTSSKSNILYMRSKHMEYPEEGRVRIPSTHLVEGYGDTSFTGTSPSTNKLILTKRSQSIGRYDYSRSKIL